MPEQMVRAEIARRGGKIDLSDDRVIMAIAKHFQVPVAICVLRLVEVMTKEIA